MAFNQDEDVDSYENIEDTNDIEYPNESDELQQTLDVDAVCELIEEAEFDPATEEVFIWTRQVNGDRTPARVRTVDELRELLFQFGWERVAFTFRAQEGQQFSVSSSNQDILAIGGGRALSLHIIDEAIRRTNVERLFPNSRTASTDVLYRREPEIILPELKVELAGVNESLIRYLAKHPESLYILEPRHFEELVAELFRDLGYEVVLTPRTRDGGLDIRAVRKDSVGSLLYVIECKRYQPSRPVSVDLVRALHGVAVTERASIGILATTSRFTKDAREFARRSQYQLSLRDYADVVSWLQQYPSRSQR